MNILFVKGQFIFEKISAHHKDIIFQWLDEPYIKEFWDNSPEHAQDIIHFIKNRPEPSVYLDSNNRTFCK